MAVARRLIGAVTAQRAHNQQLIRASTLHASHLLSGAHTHSKHRRLVSLAAHNRAGRASKTRTAPPRSPGGATHDTAHVCLYISLFSFDEFVRVCVCKRCFVSLLSRGAVCRVNGTAIAGAALDANERIRASCSQARTCGASSLASGDERLRLCARTHA